MTAVVLRALHAALDRAEAEAATVLLLGRRGIFSAGFDLQVFARKDPGEICEMMKLGAEFALRLFASRIPVVTACTGHAYPMGAFLMLASDYCIAAEGAFRIGLNEVAIGLKLPRFAVELARATLAPHYLNRLTTGEMLDPVAAEKAGYIDRLVLPDSLEEIAWSTCHSLSTIDTDAHFQTKMEIRAAAIKSIRSAIDQEINVERYRRLTDGLGEASRTGNTP